MFGYCIKHVIPKKVINFGIHLDRFKAIPTVAKVLLSFNNMGDIFDPPNNLHGMKVLDRNAFKKKVEVPCLIVESHSADDVIRIVKKYLLKIRGIKPVQAIEGGKYKVLINKKVINTWNDLDEDIQKKFKKLNVTEDNFFKVPLELTYENWFFRDLLKAALPENSLSLSSFSTIGHIIHLNINNQLLDYKNVIAEILLDNIPVAKTVVCKRDTITSVYRNFEMEILCGEPNLIASVKENQCNYELDFSKVYWNPRLGTEHNRIINMLKERDVLFDVFAGVGPFVIPVAKKKCSVFANDLNPESVKWLKHNIGLNKRAKGYIKIFSKDGGDFILTDVKDNLIKLYQDKDFSGKIHVVMNLPASAPTFIKYFKGLISEDDFVNLDVEQIKKCLPIVHCYFFAAKTQSVKCKFEEESEICVNDVEHSFHYIRNVSNSKSMYRITFTLPFNYLVADNAFSKSGEPLCKRKCTNK